MMENMGKWPSGHRKTEKLGHRLAAEKLRSLDGGTGGMISAILEVVWETSDWRLPLKLSEKERLLCR
jgi:hypothetical protein